MTEARQPCVLVADDEDAIRFLIKRVLHRAGFDVVEARDGQDAIELLNDRHFDAIVLDLMMPRVDGFGVVEHLIERKPRMMEKTVVMTAFPEAAARQRLHHVCSILSKPFDMDELIRLVRDCAEK